MVATVARKMTDMRAHFLETSKQTTEMYERVLADVHAKLLREQLGFHEYRAAVKLQTAVRALSARRKLVFAELRKGTDGLD